MRNIFSLIFLAIIISACTDKSQKTVFSNFESEFIIQDLNNYGCEKISKENVLHVLETGVTSTSRKVHDNHSIVGCSIEGKLTKRNEVVSFTFDYGGIVNFNDGSILACEEKCCENNFEYCSWERN